VTVHELIGETNKQIRDLNALSMNLTIEKNKVASDKAGLETEFMARVRAFLGTEITSPSSSAIDKLSALAMQNATITDQSLTFVRDNASEAHARAAAEIRRVTGLDASAETFPKIERTNAEDVENRRAECASAEAKYRSYAEICKEVKEGGTRRAQLMRFIESLEPHGLDAVTLMGIRSVYEPDTIMKKAARWMKGSSSYKAIRTFMADYGHGSHGVDFFNDAVEVSNQYLEAQQNVEDADTKFDLASAAYDQAKSVQDVLRANKAAISIDALQTVRDQAAKYFLNPTFVMDAKKQYGDDLPNEIPTLSIKIAALVKLQNSLAAKEDEVSVDSRTVHDLSRRLSTKPVGAKIEDGRVLDDLRLQGIARNKRFQGYVDAAPGMRTRISSMSYDRSAFRHVSGPDIVYIDNGPSVLDYYIMYELFGPSHHEETVVHHVYDAAPTPFEADLMGFDRASGKAIGLDDTLIDSLPETRENGFSLSDTMQTLDKTDLGDNAALSERLDQLLTMEPTTVDFGGAASFDTPKESSIDTDSLFDRIAASVTNVPEPDNSWSSPSSGMGRDDDVYATRPTGWDSTPDTDSRNDGPGC
jgi:hypothetical protein